MTDEDDPEPEMEAERDAPLRRMYRNSAIVGKACDAYFKSKGLLSYDLKGNKIDPMTKQQLNPYKCKPTSTD